MHQLTLSACDDRVVKQVKKIMIGVVTTLIASLIIWIVGRITGHGFVTVLRRIWRGVDRAWHWFGQNGAIPHWSIILLIALATGFVGVLAVMLFLRRRASTEKPPPAAEAAAWREALAQLADTFLDYRGQNLSGVQVENGWLVDYRERRRETVDAYQPVMSVFRSWIGDIEPEYLGEYRDEPRYFLHDYGEDDTSDGLVEKLWRPITFPEAVGFWKDWDQRKLQRLVGERIDLVDQFVRWCRNPVRGGIELHWRMRARRIFRRWWRTITRQKTRVRMWP